MSFRWSFSSLLLEKASLVSSTLRILFSKARKMLSTVSSKRLVGNWRNFLFLLSSPSGYWDPSSINSPKNQLYPLDSSLDKRIKRAKLRKESQEKAPEVLLKVLDEALKHCPLVSTILLASWFSFSSLIQQRTTRGLSVVGRLKNTPKIYYSLGGKALSLSSVAIFSKDFCPLLNSQSHSYGIWIKNS